MKLRVLIVDDEPPARRRLRRLIDSSGFAISISEAGNGDEALERVGESAPDVLFLDVQMPGRSGLGVLAALDLPLPAVVFVTAFDRYCLQAFEAHALDYLLKPFTDERFYECFERVRDVLRQQRLAEHHRSLAQLLGDLGTGARPPDRLPIRSGDAVEFVSVEAIDWVRADGNYVTLHAGSRVAMIRRSLAGLIAELPAQFVRIHRSTIVNTRRIRRLHPLFHGEYVVELEDGQKLRASRTFAGQLRDALGI